MTLSIFKEDKFTFVSPKQYDSLGNEIVIPICLKCEQKKIQLFGETTYIYFCLRCKD